jgi:hypothetical protein
MSYLADADALEGVARALKMESASALLTDAPYWEQLVADANAAAHQEVLGQLLQRGFTKAQADAWDRRVEFQRDLMMYWALTKGGALESFSDLFIRALDRRKDLLSVQVFIDGDFVNPLRGSSAPGVCSFGPSRGTAAGTIFNWPDPDDDRLDQPTRW